jgi:Flp pilus assembly protein TadG
MRNMLGRSHRGERGATVTEFAFVAPVLFLLLFGVVELARLTGSFAGVWTAAREASRYATTVGDSTVTPGVPRYLDCAGVRQAALAHTLIAQVTDSDITVRYYADDGTQVADCATSDPTFPDPSQAVVLNGYRVEVSVAGSFEAAVPILGPFLEAIDLSSTQSRSIFLGVLGA